MTYLSTSQGTGGFSSHFKFFIVIIWNHQKKKEKEEEEGEGEEEEEGEGEEKPVKKNKITGIHSNDAKLCFN